MDLWSTLGAFGVTLLLTVLPKISAISWFFPVVWRNLPKASVNPSILKESRVSGFNLRCWTGVVYPGRGRVFSVLLFGRENADARDPVGDANGTVFSDVNRPGKGTALIDAGDVEMLGAAGD